MEYAVLGLGAVLVIMIIVVVGCQQREIDAWNYSTVILEREQKHLARERRFFEAGEVVWDCEREDGSYMGPCTPENPTNYPHRHQTCQWVLKVPTSVILAEMHDRITGIKERLDEMGVPD